MLPHKTSRLTVFICLFTLLAACSNQGVDGFFRPDPTLKENPETVSPQTPTQPNQPPVVLPSNFPEIIPIYPQMTLISVEPESNNQQGKTRWQSLDPSNLIESFYQEKLISNNWQIQQPFSEDNKTLLAQNNDLQVSISVIPNSSNTELTINYQNTQNISQLPPPQTNPTTPQSFSDIQQVPEQVRQYIEDLAALGIFSNNSSQSDKFEPNKIITRREYARWLLAANNRLYSNLPSRQIRLAANTSQPTFQDVASTDPDFPIIQGLAEAGIIPSSLSGDNTLVLFRPDTPLTRETLLEWKVPLDVGKGIPTATLDSIKETWGFQDVAKIDTKAWRSLLADFQNGEQANIRRVFGYTTLFQPKKTVTRAEAAASLWYFGFQGEGISAKEALEIKPETNQP